MSAEKVSQPTGKICFVIAPIGDIESEIRIRSDQVLKHIIEPAAIACGYEPLRADKIPRPGIITSQVIQHLIDDPLVIADLTGPNANVFYELAVRHAVRKPVVQIIDAAQSIPFDVAGNRTIKFNYRDLDSAARAKDEITQQIKAVEENPEEVDTPLTQAIELQSLRRSDNPLEKSAAEIIAMLQDLKTGLNEIQGNMKKGEVAFLKPSFASEDFSGWANVVGVSPGRLEPLKLYAQAQTAVSNKVSSETGKDKKDK